jgi:diaminopimelate decarboxylase
MATHLRTDGTLELGGVSLEALAREDEATPAYVYDLDAIRAEGRELIAAFDGQAHLVAYAVKANSAGPIVRALVEAGCGADVVSGAELMLALAAGVAPDKIVYSGVAKSDAELDIAVGAGHEGIGAVQIESREEIERVAARARAAGRTCRVSLRVNPGVDAEDLDTHAYITTGHDEAKFGVPLESMDAAVEAISARPELRLEGLTSHVGSQLTSTDAYLVGARVLFDLAKAVRQKAELSFVDTGGGFGIDYGDGCPARPADFIRATRALQRELGLGDLALYCEPGRSMVAAHGVVLAKVLQRKVSSERRWLMIDAGMNDLMRPALYQALHRVVPLRAVAGPTSSWRVVGPVCESSDDFGLHTLPDDAALTYVALLDAGAYGYSMASRYNGRALPGEVFVSGGRVIGRTTRRPMSEWVEDRLAAGR